jgi:hypothetical protein
VKPAEILMIWPYILQNFPLYDRKVVRNPHDMAVKPAGTLMIRLKNQLESS